uniref:Uncharacterized protein n=1 Tax=Helicotheca tamesis TaxID=374047 RepID=A0A7S2MRA5_9STRA|mmetsp:Transcript_2069/g.2927  ORF Transcript_2069/g.2927 Transcript_2069/m.2927 type:complete len:475 (+) Transcript_2069:106-1530(+)
MADTHKEKTMTKPTTTTTATTAASADGSVKGTCGIDGGAATSASPPSPSTFPVFASLTTEEKDNINTIRQLGCEVRDLKLLIQANKDEKENGDDNGDTEILDQKLSQMDEMKHQLAKSILRETKKIIQILEGKSPNTGNINEDDLETEATQLSKILPAGKPRKDMEKRLRSIRKQRKAAKTPAFDKKLHTESLRIQRKIHHLLSSTGSGDTFRYYPNVLNTDKHELISDQLVVLTEKWDGTTVQATNRGIFKRCDKFAKGDERKLRTQSEEERYSIERLDVGFDEFLAAKSGNGGGGGVSGGDKACKYIREAVEKYYPIFASMDDDVCVFFEAVGTKIQARYRTSNLVPTSTFEPSASADASWHDIRVFDFTRNGQFLPWNETRALATKLNLPLVGYTDPPTPLDVDEIVSKLRSKLTYVVKSDVSHPANGALLEGYVVRGLSFENEEHEKIEGKEEEPIAKIRVEDLEQFASC